MSLTDRLAVWLQASLASGQPRIAVAAAIGGGLLTALTPCVYPLIPITVRYFGGMQAASRARVLSRAVVYVGGMVLLYAALGTLFASVGMVFGAALSSPWVVVLIAAFCVAMGLSMLGAFSVQLPSGINTRLSRVGGRGLGGAFLMGLVSAFIAAPCTGPVLLVILTVVAKSREIALGFALMVAFGVGLGLPFLVLALFSGALRHIPASGRWMEAVKLVLATAMFVVGIYFLDIAWPAVGEVLGALGTSGVVRALLIGAGVAALAAYLARFEHSGASVLKMLALVLLTTTIAGAVVSGSSAALTRDGLGNAGREAASGIAGRAGDSGSPLPGGTPPTARPSRIVWETSHDAALSRARSEHKPVIIDFTADWCEACKELEHKTYIDAGVIAQAARFIAIKLDATTIDDRLQKVLDRYDVLGLPTVVFIDSKGEVLTELRVTGFVPPDRFAALMAKVH